MRAVIMAPGEWPGTFPLNERYPAPLLPLADRPFIQHLIEFFAGQGITQFDFVLSHLPEKIERHLEDGKRWGSRFTYHLARDPARPYRLLKALTLESAGSEPILFGHGDRLPPIPLHEAAATTSLPLLFYWREEASKRWTGWALLSPGHIADLPADADESAFQAYLEKAAGEPPREFMVGRPLSVVSFDDFLAAHRTVLDKRFVAWFKWSDRSFLGLENDDFPQAAERLKNLADKVYTSEKEFLDALPSASWLELTEASLQTLDAGDMPGASVRLKALVGKAFATEIEFLGELGHTPWYQLTEESLPALEAAGLPGAPGRLKPLLEQIFPTEDDFLEALAKIFTGKELKRHCERLSTCAHHTLSPDEIARCQEQFLGLARQVFTPEDLARNKDLFLKHALFSGLLLACREADPGVWLSRNVMLHPTAQLFPPVFIGENCDIGQGVKLGPNAVVGKDCVLDTHCTVVNSIIFPGSYIGETLNLEDVIVDKNRLINARHGGAVTITDAFILGSMSESHIVNGITRLAARVVGALFLILAAPVLLLTALWLKLFRRGRVLHKKEAVRLPAPAEEGMWGRFALWTYRAPREGGSGAGLCNLGSLLLDFLPALVNVARGELSFVGVPPRTPEEIELLPADWKALYLRSKAGIVTEASIRYHAVPSEDELYAAEAFYAVSAGWKYDLKLLLRYLARSVLGSMMPGRQTPAGDPFREAAVSE